MHVLQRRLLDLASSNNLGGMTLREIGILIAEVHPQKIKHHLQQLEQKGLIEIDRENNVIRRVDPNANRSSTLLVVPILGAADCGSAAVFADENIQGYLRVSDRVVRRKPGLFAVKAIGSSMNQANIEGKTIEDGDYVIIDSECRNPNSTDYVLSVIDGACNIKKFILDEVNHQVVLLSESSQNYPPIVIHPEESQYFVNGKVVQVIKKPHLQ
jgi:SOS-response transcriptional repressor LexA